MRLVAALLALAGVCAPLAAAGFRPVLPRPPFPASTAQSPRAGALELAIVSSQPNAITDEAAWLRRNHLELREYGVAGSLRSLPLRKLPIGLEVLPRPSAGSRLVHAIWQRDGRLLLVYGSDFSSGSIVYGTTRSRVQSYYAAYFRNYAYAPVTAPGERESVFQEVVWAAQAGGTLYVETAHSTYAKSSGGLNAYLNAIDLRTGKLKWRSGPLVANAKTFEIAGGVIVTGYGFTAEPDYLYVLDRKDGKVISRTPVPGSPEFVMRKGSRLYVRTYDHDLVVKLVRA